MVCSVTPRPFMVVEVNLARSFLFRAHEWLEAGDTIAAGCLLREAIIRQLRAMAAWHGCKLKPRRAKHPRPGDYIRALVKAKVLGACAEWFEEMLEVGNRAAHCAPVKASHVSSCISMLHYIIDQEPCGEPTERPTKLCTKPVEETDCGCDDDDDAEWSEGGAV